ncbi:fibroblast growth factor 19 [Perognathus longimembris pacificus]|uniref:fibroblast growth factor 19 n=1 Tax=Perognathus longimembris pacificus TaxID=214514 RepID=UPI0020187281|nr:fibroblast growth factor 19 [Perognathus longimembris pacificus]
MRSAAGALVLASLWLAAAGLPLAPSDQGPHLYYRWDQPVRLRHLYAAGPYGRSHCFLRILDDGSVLCDRHRGQHGLLEIRAVSLQTVSIKDVRSVRYLCMGDDGRMQGLRARGRSLPRRAAEGARRGRPRGARLALLSPVS